MKKYWIITYQWKNKHSSTPIVSNYIHKGLLSQWILMAREQTENWVLLAAQELTEEEYGELVDVIG